MITISFNCENHNSVLLLQACFDIISGAEIETNMGVIQNTEWLLEEILQRLEEIDNIYYCGEEEGEKYEHVFSGTGLKIIEFLRAQHRVQADKGGAGSTPESVPSK